MELAKGVKDIAPEDMQLRNRVLKTITEQFLLHGFEALETPVIERMETLTAKMEGSDTTDVSKEIFRVTDQANRELGLRYDLTVPLARFVAMNKTLRLPFRRYEIGRVYRDGPIKLGRTREFIQCDADIIGSTSVLADAECINLASEVFRALHVHAMIKVNDRKVLDAVCAKLGIANPNDVIISIDKLEKVGRDGVKKELGQKGVSAQQQDALLDILLVQGTNAGKLKFLEQELGEAPLKDLRELFTYLQDDVEFSPCLARGLAYYTGTIYEAFAEESAVKSSLMGGGRYDKLIGVLTGGSSQPAVGISFGIEPLCEVLREQTKTVASSDVKVFLIPIGNTKSESVAILRELRDHHISCSMDVMDRSLSKNIEYANKSRIGAVLLVGEKDLARGVLTLKLLETGEERHIKRDQIAQLLLDL